MVAATTTVAATRTDGGWALVVRSAQMRTSFIASSRIRRVWRSLITPLLLVTAAACGNSGDAIPDGRPTTPDAAQANDASRAIDALLDATTDAAIDALVDAAPLPDAIVAVCGNGIVESGEACDDHNTFDGDCCSADCLTVLQCQGGGINPIAGEIVGTITWQGGPLSALFQEDRTGDGELYVTISNGSGVTLGNWTTDGTFDQIAGAGSYTVSIYALYTSGSTLLVSTNVDSGSASSTPLAIDLAASAGQLTGFIAENGTLLATPFITVEGLGTFHGIADGSFQLYLPPGDYVGDAFASYSVNTGLGAKIGSFPFTITAGQITDVGTTNFNFLPTTGSVLGTVQWSGDVVSGPTVSTLYLKFTDASDVQFNFSSVASDGTFTLANLAPGTYHVKVFDFPCGTQIGTQTFSIAPGQTTATVAVVDITAAASHVIGQITGNGVGLRTPVLDIGVSCGQPLLASTDGSFGFYLAAASYSANILRSAGQGSLANIQFTTQSAQTTDLGLLALSVGNAAGSVIWNGAPISVTSPVAVQADGNTSSYDNISIADSGGQNITSVPVLADGSYSVAALAPGDYTFTFNASFICAGSLTFPSQAVTITAGEVTTADIDVTASAGHIGGTIAVGGQAVDLPLISLSGHPCGIDGGHDGRFDLYLPTSDYDFIISAPNGNGQASNSLTLLTFSAPVIDGQNTTYDVVPTATGSFVSIAAAGGSNEVGGVELIFPVVTSAGTTTVIASGEGPPAPTGSTLVNLNGFPRYWSLTSAATFSGTMEVCVHVDPSAVADVGTVQLVDVQNGFTDITTHVDTTTNIVCGATANLATFSLIVAGA